MKTNTLLPTCTLFAAMLFSCASLQAAMTYAFVFDGTDGYGNDARIEGTVTFSTLPNNPGTHGSYGDPGTPAPLTIITALSLTVTGAATGNGTYGKSDYDGWWWNSGGFNYGENTLDLDTELVGQETFTDGEDTYYWGYGDYNYTDEFQDGDFTLRAIDGSSAPTSMDILTMAANNDTSTGDLMELISFAPVPEPHGFALAAGMGMLAFAACNRRRA